MSTIVRLLAAASSLSLVVLTIAPAGGAGLPDRGVSGMSFSHQVVGFRCAR